jgi:hypothetical protein
MNYCCIPAGADSRLKAGSAEIKLKTISSGVANGWRHTAACTGELSQVCQEPRPSDPVRADFDGLESQIRLCCTVNLEACVPRPPKHSSARRSEGQGRCPACPGRVPQKQSLSRNLSSCGANRVSFVTAGLRDAEQRGP